MLRRVPCSLRAIRIPPRQSGHRVQSNGLGSHSVIFVHTRFQAAASILHPPLWRGRTRLDHFGSSGDRRISGLALICSSTAGNCTRGPPRRCPICRQFALLRLALFSKQMRSARSRMEVREVAARCATGLGRSLLHHSPRWRQNWVTCCVSRRAGSHPSECSAGCCSVHPHLLWRRVQPAPRQPADSTCVMRVMHTVQARATSAASFPS